MSTSTCAEACKELFLQFTVEEKKNNYKSSQRRKVLNSPIAHLDESVN